MDVSVKDGKSATADRSRGRLSLTERWERFALAFSARTRLALSMFAICGACAWVFLQFEFDYGFVVDWAPYIIAGVPYTILVSLWAISLAVVLGLIGAFGRLSKRALPYAAASFYVSFIRGTPLLVQIFLWYSALPQLAYLAPDWARPLFVLPAIVAGILALGVNYGAYMTEIFRGGFQSIGPGQLEAAYSVGMTYRQAVRKILLPQAVRNVIPSLGNEYITMFKDSSLVGLITVTEIFRRAQEVGTQYVMSLETLMFAAAVYWLITLTFSSIQSRVERRTSRAYIR